MNATHPTDQELRLHRERCHRGWLTWWRADKPVPCLVCKPHLRRTLHTNDCDPDRQTSQ